MGRTLASVPEATWPLLLFAVALAVRVALAAATGFDGLYGQDPYAYYDYALRLRETLAAGGLPPPFFYPVGYPLLVVLAMQVVGARPIAGQVISMVAASLASPACYGLVREVEPGSKTGALVAGLAVAFAPQLVISSLSVNSDAAAFALALLAAWAMARYLSRLRLRAVALAALALGTAILTRWVYGLLALPWAVAAALAWRLRSVRPLRLAGTAALAVSIVGAVVGSQFVGELGRGEVSHIGDVAMTRWSAANAVHRRITNADGNFLYPVPVGIYYLLPIARPAFVFPLLTPLLLLGAASLRTVYRPHAVLLVGWLVTMLVFFGGFTWENPRFPLSYFAPLATLVGLGAGHAMRRWSHPRIVAVLCAAGLAGSLLWSVRDVRNFVAHKQADLETARWCEAHVPADARLLSFSLTETLRHYTSLDVAEISDATPETLPAWLRKERPAYLLVDAANLDTQWSGRTPQLNVAWLRAHVPLAKIGHAGAYTLWRIGTAALDGHAGQERP
jgi:4-amino-4-deoxy-L-arabinose transferase-like glycosyltransferase